MAFRNKGTVGPTVIVSMEPDRSGNFVCDGTADDVELQAALDYVENLGAGGEVVVKPGDYYLDAKVEVPSYAVFRGLASPRFALGSTTYLRITNGVNDDVVGNKAGATKVEIRNFDIYGNKANQANGHGINIDAQSSIIEGNYINWIKENGINSTAQQARIAYNTFSNIDGNGINANGTDSQVLFNEGGATGIGIYVNAGNQEIIGNRCFLCGAEGIKIDTAGDKVTVVDNRCNDNGTYGINCTGQWSIIANNRLNDNTGDGILINVADVVCEGNNVQSNDDVGISLSSNADRCTVVGNVIKDSGRSGIELVTVTYTTITGNTIMNNGQDGAFSGIYLYNPSYCVISSNTISDDQTGVETQQHGIFLRAVDTIIENSIVNNVCRGNQQYGINISAGPVRNRVFGNRLTGNGVGAIQDLGTDTQLPWINKEVTDPDGNVGDHPALVLPDTVDTTFRFQVPIPLEFQELVTAHVIVVQTSTGGPPDMQWSTTTDWGKLCAGENYNAGTDGETDQTTAIAQNELVCIDVSASLTGIAAGDLVGFTFIRRASQGGDTIDADAYYMGIRLRYV